MTVRSINEFLTEDHGQLDALLEGFQEWRVKDLAKAKELLAQFVAALYRHLQWEEAILFPLFERKTGQTGLTRTLLGEHREIREWLEALSVRATGQNSLPAADRVLCTAGTPWRPQR
jgi:iron-sulfur cluster repair protein YtfE (RIC family)